MPAKKKSFQDWLTREQREHQRIVQWLRYQPKLKQALWFHYPAEQKKSPFERFLWSIMGGKKGVSDFLFLEPRGKYCGLAVELKVESPYRKNKVCKFPEQEKFLLDLRQRGWKAEFAVGFDEAFKLITEYFAL